MKSLTVRLPDDVHAEVVARAEAELRPINGILRRLIELWLAGQVDLTPPAAPRLRAALPAAAVKGEQDERESAMLAYLTQRRTLADFFMPRDEDEDEDR